MINKTCLSYWFPKLETAGLPVPKTRWLRTELDLWPLCDGVTPDGFRVFVADIERMASEVRGFPCFLRTGHTSGKHQWKNTCYLPDAASIPGHVAALVEFSAMADIMGLPASVWVVRE